MKQSVTLLSQHNANAELYEGFNREYPTPSQTCNSDCKIDIPITILCIFALALSIGFIIYIFKKIME
jgi:hypothetical protein